MKNGANVLYVDVCFAADVLHMLVNSHVICKMESNIFSIVENDLTLCQDQRKVRFNFLCIHFEV